jgi:hypothetical protein
VTRGLEGRRSVQLSYGGGGSPDPPRRVCRTSGVSSGRLGRSGKAPVAVAVRRRCPRVDRPAWSRGLCSKQDCSTQAVGRDTAGGGTDDAQLAKVVARISHPDPTL